MAAPPIPNVWHLRKVAETSAKSCDVCYKPSTSVLITPDNKDFFYVCPGHLKDGGFCNPVVDEAEVAAKKRKEEMEREIEVVKREYEEKMKKKKKEKKKKSKDDKKDDSNASKDEDEEKAEREKNDKINAITNTNAVTAADDMPRIYALQKVFYQKRLDRLRNLEMAKKNRERMRNPAFFPSVPTGDLD